MGRSKDQPSRPRASVDPQCRLPAETWGDVCCGNCPPHDWWDDEAVAASRPVCLGTSDALDPLYLARTYALSYKGPREVSEEHAWASECVFMMLHDHPAAALEIIRLAAEFAARQPRPQDDRRRRATGTREPEVSRVPLERVAARYAR